MRNETINKNVEGDTVVDQYDYSLSGWLQFLFSQY